MDRKTPTLFFSALVTAAALLLMPQVRAQVNSTGTGSNSSSVIPPMRSDDHITWIEQFDGSSNTEGEVMLLDSSVGYLFGPEVLVNGGIPVYFVRANSTTSSGTSTTSSVTALGDIYGQVRLSFPNPAVNFKTQFTGRAPTGSTSDGISTGHATYDWTSRIDRVFGQWTPFLEVGLANSIPDSFVYRRPFASYGELAHFQAGAAHRVASWISVAASGFAVTPWGSQTVNSRVAGKGSASSNGHGPAFLQASQTTGGSSLAADNGFSAGLDLSPRRGIDLSVSYSRSTHYDLNTVSFGFAVNMRTIFLRSAL